MNNILIVNPFGIGDVLFTTPLIANLKRAHPQARIVYLCNRRAAEVLSADQGIAKVLVYERDEFVAVYKKNPIEFAMKWLGLAYEIREARFDVVFDFSLNSTFGFLGLYAGIKRRIGFDHKGRGRLLSERIPLAGYEGRHVIEHYLDLLNRVGVPVTERYMSISVGASEEKWAKDWLKEKGIALDSLIIALVPGGGQSWGAAAKNKRWPADKYARLADNIFAKCPGVIILLGDSKETQLAQDLIKQAHVPLYSAVGQTSILQMAALMRHCRLVIVNDGGPLHIAVAAGVKTVSIFGPVDPRVYGPYPSEGHVVIQKGLACQPCYRRFRMAQCSHVACLNNLSIEEVTRKVESLL